MDALPRQLGKQPGLAFALSGGVFALLFVFVWPVGELAPFFVGERPLLFGLLLVATSSLSAFAVGSCLWRQFVDGRSSVSRWRSVLLGTLVGTLSMPLTMYLLTISRYLFVGVPDGVVIGSPPPGATHWIPVEKLLLQDFSIALFTSLFGFMFTGGLTILVGGATGEALRRFTERAEETQSSA